MLIVEKYSGVICMPLSSSKTERVYCFNSGDCIVANRVHLFSRSNCKGFMLWFCRDFTLVFLSLCWQPFYHYLVVYLESHIFKNIWHWSYFVLFFMPYFVLNILSSKHDFSWLLVHLTLILFCTGIERLIIWGFVSYDL